jgi:hypothetical protein
MFRIRPYDDYTTDPGAPLDNVLQQALEADSDRLVAAVALILCKMHAAAIVSDNEVLSILNHNRGIRIRSGEWEVTE